MSINASISLTEERKQLISKLHSIGVGDIHGKNPYTMPIDELKALCDWIEKYKVKNNNCQ